MRVSRSKFALSTAATYAGLAFVRYPAGAAEFTYKWSTDVNAEHPVAARATEAAANILKATNGQLEIRVFPNSSLGGQAEVIAQVRLGALELNSSADNVTEGVVPVAGLGALPFAFASHKIAWSAMDGALGAYIRAACGKAGIYVLDKYWDAGFREISNTARPIHTPADLRGLKIRVPESPIENALFKALGASPTSVTGAEMYSALKTHLVDGTEVPLTVLWVRKLYEAQKYVSLTNFVWTGYQVQANPAAWQRLPKNVRDVAERNINAGADLSRSDILKLDASLQDQLTKQGMVFNDADVPSFKAAIRSAGLYGQWRDHYGAEGWAVLEKSVGPLR